MDSPKLNSLVLQLTSDFVCGRQNEALATLQFICDLKITDEKLFLKFFFTYIEANYHLNPELFLISFKLIKSAGAATSNYYICHLIAFKSSHFNLRQLELLLDNVTENKVLAQMSNARNPILVSLLNNDMAKVELFLNYKFRTDIKYESITIYETTTIDGESFCNSFRLNANPEFEGMLLYDVILLEYPELLQTANVKFGSC
jgi:hypothetical protein